MGLRAIGSPNTPETFQKVRSSGSNEIYVNKFEGHHIMFTNSNEHEESHHSSIGVFRKIMMPGESLINPDEDGEWSLGHTHHVGFSNRFKDVNERSLKKKDSSQKEIPEQLLEPYSAQPKIYLEDQESMSRESIKSLKSG